ncbi:MAG: Ig-like domain-containing protein [Gemmatimonadota bacterium]
MTRRLVFAAALVVVGSGLTACSDDKTTAPVPVASSLSIMSGDAQQTTPNTPITAPLVVEVKDQNGDAFEDQVVTWAISSGTGTLSSNSSASDANGQASVTYIPDDQTGTITITATVGTLTPVNFSVTVVDTN